MSSSYSYGIWTETLVPSSANNNGPWEHLIPCCYARLNAMLVSKRSAAAPIRVDTFGRAQGIADISDSLFRVWTVDKLNVMLQR